MTLWLVSQSLSLQEVSHLNSYPYIRMHLGTGNSNWSQVGKELAAKHRGQTMGAAKRREKPQVRHRQRHRTQTRRGRLGGKRTTVRRMNHRQGKKRPVGKYSKKAQNLQFDSVRMTNEAQNLLHFCVHDLYKKVSLAAERLRKKKRHVSITASDVKNALKKIFPWKANKKSAPSMSCKCR
uniref:Uncharacterized protein n=1 Tax=Sphaerodactylus townsendi TaxID=933632 RepID=A0ACB8F2C5_9SAUR